MSIENLAKFAEAAATDDTLQNQIRTIQAQAVRETAEKIAALATEAGVPITAEEFLAASQTHAGSLSDEELATVAGGAWEPTVSNIVLSFLTVGIACGAAAVASAATKGNVDGCQLSSGYLK